MISVTSAKLSTYQFINKWLYNNNKIKQIKKKTLTKQHIHKIINPRHIPSRRKYNYIPT